MLKCMRRTEEIKDSDGEEGWRTCLYSKEELLLPSQERMKCGCASRRSIEKSVKHRPCGLSEYEERLRSSGAYHYDSSTVHGMTSKSTVVAHGSNTAKVEGPLLSLVQETKSVK